MYKKGENTLFLIKFPSLYKPTLSRGIFYSIKFENQISVLRKTFMKKAAFCFMKNLYQLKSEKP